MNNDQNKFITQNYLHGLTDPNQTYQYILHPYTDQNLLAYSYLNNQLYPSNLHQLYPQNIQNISTAELQHQHQIQNFQTLQNLTTNNIVHNQEKQLLINNNGLNNLNNKETVQISSPQKGDESSMNDSISIHNDFKPTSSSSNLRGTEIFIGNLAIDTEEGEIKKLFQEFGDILDVRIHKAQNKKCYAFVRFLTKEQAKSALVKNGVVLNFRQIKVTKSNDNTTIFIGNIRKNWTNNDVEVKVRRIFPNCEKIEHFQDPNIEGRNRGFCFVVFKSRNEAIKALNYVQSKGGINIDGIPLTCDWADIVDEDDSGSKQVFVSGIKEDLDENKLSDAFSKYGSITEIILSRNHKTSKRKDIGFITFSTNQEAKDCVDAFKTKEAQIPDCPLTVTHAFSQQTMLAKKKLKEMRKNNTSSDPKPNNTNNNLPAVNNNNVVQPNNMMNMLNLINLNKNPNMMAQVMASAFMMMNQMNTTNTGIMPDFMNNTLNTVNNNSLNASKNKDTTNKRVRLNFNNKRKGNQNNSSNNNI